MKKLNIVSTAFILSTLLTGVAFAEEGTVTKTSVVAKIEALRVQASSTKDVKERIASTTERLKEAKREKSDIEKRIGKKLDEQRTKIAQKFEEALKNLNNLVTRVESRIAKIEAAGGNVTAVKASLDLAKAKVALADADLTTLENMLASSTATSTKKEMRAAVKIQTEKTKKSVEAAHKAIVKVISSLKPGQIRKEAATSTTATTTATTNATSTGTTTHQ